MKNLELYYDVVVIGGGMSGLVAAIASARKGAKTALVHNRSVLGGNASSEIRMHIGGADFHSSRTNSRETGILEELLLANKKCNPQKSYSEFDRVLWEHGRFQENLDLHLNVHVDEVTSKDRDIKSVSGIQNTTETRMTFKGNIFIDATGDATVAAFADAEIMYGRDSKAMFDEVHAPVKADEITMGLTLMFTTRDMGKPMPFKKPKWAYDFTEEDLKDRGHSAHGSNYWWIELGGEKLHTIFDGETIRDELLKCVYGVWDHIKNGGDHQADNFVLDWVGFLPGKRESRRVVGDYILTEHDVVEATQFEDVVAYGGWPMDMHAVGGLYNVGEPTEFINVPEIYGIPYRSLVSKAHDNLLLGGRAISVSRMAFGSTRLMATCAVVGQAVGTAAGMCTNYDVSLREIDIHSLQEALMLDDAYLPKVELKPEKNLIHKARLTASSSEDLGLIRDGVLRDAYDEKHGWSDDVEEAFIEMSWDAPVYVETVKLYLDSNLSRQIMISHFKNGNEDQIDGLPYELVESYQLECFRNGQCIKTIEVNENAKRLNTLSIDLELDQIKWTPLTTYGDNKAKVFEIVVL